MRPFSSKTISTGSYTIGSFAKRSTLKSGLIWMLFRDSSGERGGWSAYFLLQPTRKIKAIKQYSFRFIIGLRCQVWREWPRPTLGHCIPLRNISQIVDHKPCLVRSDRRWVGATATLKG